MWADNETEIDLLGFDYLVDALELILTEPRLLPVTVGAMGDWGSGKTSLMSMAARRLEARDGYVTVAFSPWRFEGYDDVKTALMGAVLNKLIVRAQQDPTRWERVRGLFAQVANDLRVLSRLAPAGGAIAAAAAGVPIEAGAAVGTALAAAAGPTDGAGEEGAGGAGEYDEPLEFSSVANFRSHFRKLVSELDDVHTVVVFIDDLDRCLPETTVATFEAIRLFLHVPKTAYVVAAHPQIVQAAVDARYADNREGDANLGRDYLEKIVQVSITVPPLAEPEVETYINLLFADLYLDEEPFERVRAAADDRRTANHLGVAMNYGIAADTLGEVPENLQRAFELANRIAPTLARGLRGNPRQVKRFLNTLILRLRTAALRSVELDAAVLAKLMVLELSLVDFERLFRWQLAQDGQPSELAQGEVIARQDRTPNGTGDDVKAWAAQPHIAEWLKLDPSLAGVALGRYFFFSRDRLSPAAPAARLSTAQQDLLGRLQLGVAAQRRAAIDEAAALAAEEVGGLYEALLERGERDPRSPALTSALEWAAKDRSRRPAFAASLGRIPPTAVPPSVPPSLRVAFPDRPHDIEAVLDRWETEGRPGLRDAVRAAREA